MEGPISFRGYKEQESNLILPEHDDDDDDDDDLIKRYQCLYTSVSSRNGRQSRNKHKTYVTSRITISAL